MEKYIAKLLIPVPDSCPNSPTHMSKIHIHYFKNISIKPTVKTSFKSATNSPKISTENKAISLGRLSACGHHSNNLSPHTQPNAKISFYREQVAFNFGVKHFVFSGKKKEKKKINSITRIEQTILNIKKMKEDIKQPKSSLTNPLFNRSTSLKNSIVVEDASAAHINVNYKKLPKHFIIPPTLSFSMHEPTHKVFNDWVPVQNTLKQIDLANQPQHKTVRELSHSKQIFSIDFNKNMQVVKKLIRSFRELKSLKLTLQEIYDEEIFSQKPYRRRHSIDFFKAVKEGSTEIMQYYLTKDKYLVYDMDLIGMTPLHWAVKKCNIDAVKILLNHNANPNSKDSTGKTPLIIACTNNNMPIAKALILKRANPFLKTSLNVNALEATTSFTIKNLIHRAKLFHIALNFVSYKKLEEVWKNWEEFINVLYA